MKTVYAKNKNGDLLAFKTPESLVYISDSVTLSDKLNEIETSLNTITTTINNINTQLDNIEASIS